MAQPTNPHWREPLVVCRSSCGGGLLIGLQLWVVGFFLDGFGNSGGGLGCDHDGWAMSLVGLSESIL